MRDALSNMISKFPTKFGVVGPYFIYVRQLYDILEKYSSSGELVVGENGMKSGNDWILFKEKERKKNCSTSDRYGFKCIYAIDADDNDILKIRDEAYPY